MVWPVFQKINWAVLLRIDCHVQTYLQMLELMIPRLNELFENENEVYFQQDGAPPHFHVNVRNFLARTFSERWIGRRGNATEFPPRSPDLTPLDVGNLKKRGVRHKTTNTGGTERSDSTCHQ